jgi:hypothetical protein
MRTPYRAALLAALVLAAAGCGSSPAPATDAPGSTTSAGSTDAPGAEGTPGVAVTIPDDPCSLLTADDLAGQYGVDFSPAVAAEISANRTDCLWEPQTADGPVGAVTMVVMPVNEEQWDLAIAQPNVVLVPELGDGAFFTPLVPGALESRVGDVLLRFRVDRGTLSQADHDAGLIAIAKTAASGF